MRSAQSTCERVVFAVVALAVAAGSSTAQSTTWDGSENSSWDDADNWSAGVPNAATDAIVVAAPNDPDLTGSSSPTCLGLTIAAGGVLTVPGSATLTVGAGATISGDLLGVGTVRFTGTGTVLATVGITEIEPIVEIQGGASDTATFAGTELPLRRLTLTSGTLRVATGNKTDVSGIASFTGGTLERDAGLGGVLDFSGAVTFSGTSVTNPPGIAAAGAWSSDENFAPESNTLAFDGSARQTLVLTGSATQFEFFDLIIPDGSDVTASEDIYVGGTLLLAGILTTSGTIDVDGIMGGDASGAINLGTGGGTFAGDFSFGGTLSSAGMIVFDGGGTQFITTESTLPDVDVDSTGSVVFSGAAMAMSGLTLENGNLAIGASTTATVTGAALFNGGLLAGTGTLDVAGDVTFAGTAVTTPPDLRVGGDLSLDENFAPTTGTVTFDGTVTGQQVLLTGAGTTAFFGLAIESDAGITLSTPLAVAHDLTVLGSLTLNGSLDVDGDTSGGGPNASMNLGGSGGAFGGDFEFGGSLSSGGMIVFDGSDTQYIETDTTLPDTDVIATGTVVFGNLTIGGNLEVLSGTLEIADTKVARVTGTATLSGGTLRSEGSDDVNSGTLDLDGDAVFSGTTVTASPDLECAANWTADLNFNPDSGQITFDGTGTQMVDVTGGASFGRFFDVTIGPGATVVSTANLNVGGYLTVEGSYQGPGGGAEGAGTSSLDVDGAISGSGVIDISTGTADVGADFTFDGTLTADVLVFDTLTTQSINTTITLPDVSILTEQATDKVTVGGASLTIGGDLDLTQGIFEISAGTTTNLTGNLNVGEQADLAGDGTLSVGNLTFFLPPLPFNWQISEDWPTIDGNVTITGGLLTVFPGVTLEVLGDLELNDSGPFSYTALAGFGTVDVSGDFTWDNVETGNAPFFGVDIFTPSFEVGGDWTVDETFVPTQGSFTFDGTGTQTVTLTGVASEVLFQDLVVASSSTVDVGSAATVHTFGSLDCDGSLTAPSAVYDVEGDFDLDAAGALSMGSGTHTFGGSYLESGTLTQPGAGVDYVFAASAAATIAAADFTLPPFTVTGSGPFTFCSLGTTTVNGDMVIANGAVGFADPLVVLGDAQFLGGAWSGATSPIDVAGDVDFSGTLAAGAHDLDCGGDWIAGTTFAPTGGTVTLDGPGDTQVASVTGTGDLSFSALHLSGGKRTLSTTGTVRAESVQVDFGAELDMAGGTFEVATGPLDVDGALTFGSGGTLRLAPSVTATMSSSSALSMAGDWPEEASVVGLGGSGYTFLIDGSVSAMNFRFEDMGPTGVILTPAATLAASPFDFRGGAFDRPDAAGGSLEFAVDRTVPTTFHYTTFENSTATGTFNVGGTVTAPVLFQNYGGAFSGPAFESDTLGAIFWGPPTATTLSAFDVTVTQGAVTLDWTTSSEVDLDAFVVERGGGGPGGTFTPLGELVAVGPSAYQFTDNDPQVLSAQTYRLAQRLTHGLEVPLATSLVVIVPPRAGLVERASVTKIGPAAPGILQASLDSLTEPNRVLLLEPGRYDAFHISSSTPGGLKLLAPSGGVTIDTVRAPVRIDGLPAGRSLELVGLTLTGATSGADLVVADCDGLVLLDGVVCASGILAARSAHLVLQSCDLADGLLSLDGSHAVVGRSAVEAADLLAGSVLHMDELGSTRIARDSEARLTAEGTPQPGLEVPHLLTPGGEVGFHLEGPPRSPWLLLASGRLTWLEQANRSIRTIGLLDPTGLFEVGSGRTDLLGRSAGLLALPPALKFPGSRLALQAAVILPDGHARLSTGRTVLLQEPPTVAILAHGD